jgi:hypothetical protein
VELFLKFYADKPGRIGIKYTYEFQAVKAYEDLVRLLGDSGLDALFELAKDRITLVLTSQFNGKQARYQSLEFKSRELQKLRSFGEGHTFEFVHIYAHHNTLMVAKPFRKARFFLINNIEMRGADFLKEDL